MLSNELILKYGCNPNQKPAKVYMADGELPFEVLNGNPGYINFLDAFNSWQLVKELSSALKLPAAASFKHVSPAGAAVYSPLSDTLKKIYWVDDLELSPVAVAYAKARGADRMSSFGDWIAISDKVDASLAKLIAREVSDGIIAPEYDADALEILKSKRKGSYNIIKMDPDYEPKHTETREVYGISMQQRRNDCVIDRTVLQNIVTNSKDIPDSAKNDLILALITLKYTQSNSVCYAKDGQVIGVGAGQQSRIHCTRLAGEKADLWYLRQHPSVLSLKFADDIKRPDRDNAIDQYLRTDITDAEISGWSNIFKEIPKKLTSEERRAWLDTLKGVSLGSDAFFPFRDNIDRAYKTGVSYIVQPGGSIRDDIVIEACNEYGIVMVCNEIRLFHH